MDSISLAELLSDMRAELPANIRKVVNTALENDWELNKPGVTIALRLNHPKDELADPVYITWVVGRTASGKISYRFDSCGTRGLVPLSGADLLEYLADPTVAYVVAEEREKEMDDKARNPPWKVDDTPERNTIRQLGGTLLGIQREYAPRVTSKAGVAPSPVSAKPLRVMLPKL